jgi:uncharacterized OB-fold protein
MADALRLPAVDEEARPFWEGARRGELRVQQCPDTGRLLFPPRARSPWGDRRRPGWTRVCGRGRIWSFAVPHPPLLPPFDALAPYVVVLVALEEDARVRLVGNLVARPGGSIGEVQPAAVTIGAPVRVVFEPITEEVHLPCWQLDPAPPGS